MADKVDLGERFLFLDSAMLVDRGISVLPNQWVDRSVNVFDALPAGQFGVLAKWIPQNVVNWDPALHGANRWYDRLVAAMRIQDRRARQKAFDQIEHDLRKLRADASDAGNVTKFFFAAKQPDKAMGKILGDILITLLSPAFQAWSDVADRTEQSHRNLHIAFSLAAYHRDHDSYPKKLDALAPKYLPKIPNDLFSGKALIYRPSKKGYLLYSVGVNGEDEGGRFYNDDPHRGGDDIGVRMPLPKLAGK